MLTYIKNQELKYGLLVKSPPCDYHDNFYFHKSLEQIDEKTSKLFVSPCNNCIVSMICKRETTKCEEFHKFLYLLSSNYKFLTSYELNVLRHTLDEKEKNILRLYNIYIKG